MGFFDFIGNLFGAASQDQANDQSWWMARHGLKRNIRQAGKFGIDPLAALGASSPQFMGGGVDWGSVGSSAQSLTAGDRELGDLQRELLRAQIDTEHATASTMLQDAQSRTAMASIAASARSGAVPTPSTTAVLGVGMPAHLGDVNQSAAGELGDVETARVYLNGLLERYGPQILAMPPFGANAVASDIFTSGSAYRKWLEDRLKGGKSSPPDMTGIDFSGAM